MTASNFLPALFVTRLCAAVLFCLLAMPAMAQQAQDTAQPANQEGASNASDAQSGDEAMMAHNEEMTEQEKLHLKMHTEFAEFARGWVDKLNHQPNFNPGNGQMDSDGDAVVLRYHQLQYRSAVVRESVTMPGNFSGLLRYWDVVVECRGADEAEAKSGAQCENVEGTAQAYCEIFQYKNGKWF